MLTMVLAELMMSRQQSSYDASCRICSLGVGSCFVSEIQARHQFSKMSHSTCMGAKMPILSPTPIAIRLQWKTTTDMFHLTHHPLAK